jgi:uncharacterized protein YgbK (DUF1537 family)
MTPPVIRIGIIADDLTSAGDGAAPFTSAGFRAQVRLSPSPCGPIPPGVTAVNVGSRTRPVKDAACWTARVANRLAGADVLFKTVDSTLRGHLFAEIEAALVASGRDTAVVAPAFPCEGRKTLNGIQYAAGLPVDQTWFAHDPNHPVRCADLLCLLPGAAWIPPGRASELTQIAGAVRYIVADAASDNDLDELVAAVPQAGQVLWAGSPGLAAALARRLAPLSDPASPAIRRVSGSRVLFAVGSLNPVSREQLDRICSVSTIEPIPITDDGAIEMAEQQLVRRGTAVLYGPREPMASRVVPTMLAQGTAWLAKVRAFDALVLTGGETASCVLLALGARTIELGGEAEPGISLGFIDHPWRIPVITKAGGFGDPNLLARLRDLMITMGLGR